RRHAESPGEIIIRRALAGLIEIAVQRRAGRTLGGSENAPTILSSRVERRKWNKNNRSILIRPLKHSAHTGRQTERILDGRPFHRLAESDFDLHAGGRAVASGESGYHDWRSSKN